jgi:hypothetical protein
MLAMPPSATSATICWVPPANLTAPRDWQTRFRNLPGFEGAAFYTNSTRSRYDLNRVYPQFNNSLTEYMRNDGLSWYDADPGSYKSASFAPPLRRYSSPRFCPTI